MTPLEYILNLIALLLFIGSVIYLLMEWSALPNQVPIHYNEIGEVDGWGNKATILIAPVIGAILWIGITIVEKYYPYLYYYSNPTKENMKQQSKNGRLMLNVIKNITITIFTYTVWNDVRIAIGYDTSLGTWFLSISLISLFGPICYFIIKSIHLRKMK